MTPTESTSRQNWLTTAERVAEWRDRLLGVRAAAWVAFPAGTMVRLAKETANPLERAWAVLQRKARVAEGVTALPDHLGWWVWQPPHASATQPDGESDEAGAVVTVDEVEGEPFPHYFVAPLAAVKLDTDAAGQASDGVVLGSSPSLGNRVAAW